MQIAICIIAYTQLLVVFILARGYVVDWFGHQNTPLLLGILALGIAALAAVFIILKKKEQPAGRAGKIPEPAQHRVPAGMARLYRGDKDHQWSAVCLADAADGPGPAARILGQHTGVYCFAWLGGFIMPGAPDGMGIREAYFRCCWQTPFARRRLPPQLCSTASSPSAAMCLPISRRSVHALRP